MVRRSLGTASIVVAVLLGAAEGAAADDDKATAHALFLAGQRAFNAGEFKTAAAIFEDAYRKKPHHDVLWNAASAWNRAGEDVRAANLYARYLRDAPPEAPDRKAATAALATLTTRLGKVVLRASGLADPKLDDVSVEPEGRYVTPGEHSATARSGDTTVRRSLRVAAGQSLEVTLEPPPPPPKPKPTPPPRAEEGGHLPWVVVAIGGAAALAGGGLTIWSGLDTSAKRERFRERVASGDATQAELDEGRATQLRTNVLLGVTLGLTALTGLGALFVDWGGRKAGGLFLRPGLGYVTVGYRR